jgi:hypothetical protein
MPSDALSNSRPYNHGTYGVIGHCFHVVAIMSKIARTSECAYVTLWCARPTSPKQVLAPPKIPASYMQDSLAERNARSSNGRASAAKLGLDDRPPSGPNLL